MTDRFPTLNSASWAPSGQPWQPSLPPPRPRRQKGSDALVLVLAGIIAVLLVTGGVAAAINADSGHDGTAASLKTSHPGPTSTTPTTGPGGVAPVSPLAAPPVTAPSVRAKPLKVAPSVVAAIVSPAVVDIDTRLAYQHAIAAGTGMILTPDGMVLTNNHVIDGATTIGAVSIGTGRTYSAHVVGVDPTADVAVIQLEGAVGLPTITSDPNAVSPGDADVAVGNAGGLGGTPSVTAGSIQAIGQSIIASDPAAGTSEQLDGLLESSAVLQPGDSGGPLVNASGQVIGMDTAASVADQGATSVSFAIPIARALAIASQIQAGQASSTIHLGLPPFLGVQVTPGEGLAGRAGAFVSGVVQGGPAAAAGLAPGVLIVAIDGQTIDSSATLTTVLRQFRPGEVVTVTWLDRSGGSHTTRVALTTGPAD